MVATAPHFVLHVLIGYLLVFGVVQAREESYICELTSVTEWSWVLFVCSHDQTKKSNLPIKVIPIRSHTVQAVCEQNILGSEYVELIQS